jgi:hypothetical protein
LAPFEKLRKKNMPFDHDYTLKSSFGLVGAERSEIYNPAEDSELSQEEWDEMTEDEQDEYLMEVAQDWAMQYIDIYFEE